MTLYILDTDHISLFQKSHPQVAERAYNLSPEEIAVTVISAEEQIRGWLNAIRRAEVGDRLTWGYLGLRLGIEFFNSIRVLDFNEAAFKQYLYLRSTKIRVGTQDLRIASIVLAQNGILVTRNRRDFGQVSGLNIQDWTQ
ncbi:MAG: type II toxin-antitoxin system VapC family toxin [Caldilineaceae bacterium]